MTAHKCNLDRELWRRFIENRLSAEESDDLIRHLEEECVDCERFLEELGPDNAKTGLLWAAQGLSERLFAQIEPRQGVAERDEIFRNVITRINNPPDHIPSPKKWLYGLAPGAIMALFVMVIFQFINPAGYKGIKGTNVEPPSIILQVAVLKGNSTGVPVRGIPGDGYRPEDALIFRYELNTRGFVYLLKANGGSIDLIDPADASQGVQQEKGVYEFRKGEQTLGYPLSDLIGRQVFIVVATRRPLELNRELEPLVRRYLNNEVEQHTSDWAFDSFEIAVTR